MLMNISVASITLLWGKRVVANQNISPNLLQKTMFSWLSPFSKKIGFLAARLVARNFTRALGYAKRPLLPVPDIACWWQRVLVTTRVAAIAYARHCVRPTSHTSDIACSWHRSLKTLGLSDLHFMAHNDVYSHNNMIFLYVPASYMVSLKCFFALLTTYPDFDRGGMR